MDQVIDNQKNARLTAVSPTFDDKIW